jgi:ankyrin repeat protein
MKRSITHFVRYTAEGALNATLRDTEALDAILKRCRVTYPHMYNLSKITDSWVLLFYRVIILNRNKNHLSAVKSQFEDLYSATIESYIDGLHDPYGTDTQNLCVPFLKALVNADFEGLLPSTQGPLKSSQATNAIDWTADTDAPTQTIDPPVVPTLKTRGPSFADFAWAIIQLRRLWRIQKRSVGKQTALDRMLRLISEQEVSPDEPAWSVRLAKYPLFAECPGLLDTIRPHVQLQQYEPGQTIMAKGESAPWIGWLLCGVTKYVATYSQSFVRREWVTSETALTIGVVGALLDLPSLIEHWAESECLLATIPSSEFKRVVQEHKNVEQYLQRREFGTSFAIMRECLRIEIEFGHPWWDLFHDMTVYSPIRPDLVARILESSSDPQIVTELSYPVGTELGYPVGVDSYTPLDLAAMRDDIEVAKVFLQHGARVRSQTIEMIVGSANVEFLELVLTRQGAAGVVNECIRSGEKEFVQKLQLMLKETQGSVPMTTAPDKAYATEIVEPQETPEHEPNEANSGHKAPLREELLAAIQECVKNGENDVQSLGKLTLLLNRLSHETAASSLLNRTLDHDGDGSLPLNMAINHGRLTLIALLLQYGADANLADEHELYPLDYAMKAECYHKEMAKLLLDHGATKSSKERRAQLAQLKERIRIVEEHGSEWATIVGNASNSSDALSQLRNILEKSEHPRLTANILLTTTQTALDLGIAQNNVDLVVLLLRHGAWPAEKTALASAEANDDLDPKIIEALREHLPAAFKVAESTDMVDTDAKEEAEIEEELPIADHDPSQDANDKVAVNLAEMADKTAAGWVKAAKTAPPFALSMFKGSLRYPHALGLLKASRQSCAKEQVHAEREMEELD